MTDFSQLRVLLLLNESPTHKTLSLLLTSLSEGKYQTSSFNSSRAKQDPNYLVSFCSAVLEKTPTAFTLAQAEKSVYSAAEYNFIASAPTDPTTSVIAENDIYYRYLSRFSSTHKIQFIHPCTVTHIRKYMSVPLLKVEESKETYVLKVKPWIDSNPASRTAWIDKIVKKEAEVEDVLHFEEAADGKGDGFIVVPDSKWDRTTVANLYLLVIANNGARLKSLRDLRGQDIGFLENIKQVVESLMFEKYRLEKSGLRLFVHYQPSYYHFHVHVVNAQMEATGGMAAGQAHLLEDIIDNIKLDGEYYARRTLTYFLGQTHELVSVLGLSQ
ncbi:UNVERIFIED_CONTAM: hypothetical protein HDU68_005265 [Siphonaria sp. JEL0065]|nr:hypothetical protein HDU68_005265 [Siphonaria sp. JEL0065]